MLQCVVSTWFLASGDLPAVSASYSGSIKLLKNVEFRVISTCSCNDNPQNLVHLTAFKSSFQGTPSVQWLETVLYCIPNIQPRFLIVSGYQCLRNCYLGSRPSAISFRCTSANVKQTTYSRLSIQMSLWTHSRDIFGILAMTREDLRMEQILLYRLTHALLA